MEVLLVYLWGIYPQVGNLALIFEILLFIAIFFLAAITVIAYTDPSVNAEDELKELLLKYTKTVTFTFLMLVTIDVLTPTRNVLTMMVAAPKILEVADSNNTKQIGRILQNSLDILESKTEELKTAK